MTSQQTSRLKWLAIILTVTLIGTAIYFIDQQRSADAEATREYQRNMTNTMLAVNATRSTLYVYCEFDLERDADTCDAWADTYKTNADAIQCIDWYRDDVWNPDAFDRCIAGLVGLP